MRVLLAVPRYDYGKPELGDSFEYTSWFGPLIGLGNDVELFDTFGPGWKGDPAATGRALLETASAWKPDLVLTLLLEDEIPMATVDQLRGSCPVVNWFADDTWRFWAFSRHIAHHFSWVVTTSRKAKEAYDRMPGVRAHLSPWGYDPATYHPVGAEPVYDIGFVGQRYGRRGRVVDALRAEGFSVTARGSGWPDGRIESSGLAAQFASARINLSFLESSAGPFKRLGMGHMRGTFRADRLISKVLTPPLQLKARPFEVTACGAFLLTDVVPELLEFFHPGKEIGTFHSAHTLRRAITYYLEHDDERRAIARAGLERSGAYSWPRVLTNVLEQ
jgi:spore maturation protein CgeB